jgi:hypothetical protein
MRTLKVNSVAVASLALLLLAGPAHAKCKFQTDTVNPIAGETVQWTKWGTFRLMNEVGKSVVHTAIVEGDRRYLGLRIEVHTKKGTRPTKEDLDTALVIPAESAALLLMDDESILELPIENGVIGEADFIIHSAREYTIEASATAKFAVDAAAIEALENKRIKEMRIVTADGNLDFEFGKKGSKKFQDEAECL